MKQQHIGRNNLTSRRIRFSVSLLLLTFTMAFILTTNAMQIQQPQEVLSEATLLSTIDSDPVQKAPSPSKQPDDAEPAAPKASNASYYHTINHTVKNGETLTDILETHGLIHEFKHMLGMGKENLKKISRLKSNKPIDLIRQGQSLHKVVYHLSASQRIVLEKQESGKFSLQEEVLKVDKSLAYASSSIENSLYLAGRKLGISDKLIIQMAGILGWDIDFAFDIRDGDYFTIIYEEEYLQGAKINDGKILALHFFNNGKHYRIISYKNKQNREDYYTLEGKSVRKAFLRSPLDFAYISSHFNLRRKHPVLHTIRAHKGVDYAAKTGTPIRAAGDGKIVLRKWHGGYGKTVAIQHGRTYKTLYGHMSRFAKKQRVGSYVKQGQTIGYVGSTGMSTGPHLHYEFHVNGVARNPVKVKLPDAKPLAKSEMARFRAQTQRLRHQLDLLSKAHIASLPSSKNATE